METNTTPSEISTSRTRTAKKGLGAKTSDAIAADKAKPTAPATAPMTDEDVKRRTDKLAKAITRLVDEGKPANLANIAAEVKATDPKNVSSYLSIMHKNGDLIAQEVDGSGTCYVVQAKGGKAPEEKKAAKPAAAPKAPKAPKTPAAPKSTPQKATDGERRIFVTTTYYCHLATDCAEPVALAATRNVKKLASGNFAMWLTSDEYALMHAQWTKDAGKTEPRIGLAKTAHGLLRDNPPKK